MASPMARLQKKMQAAVNTGSARSTGIPRAMVLRLIRDLPGVRALIATVVERNTCFAQLDPSVGGSGPHDFAVRIGRARLALPLRPSHPASHVRDDWPKRPSRGGGTRGDKHNFRKNGSKIFGREG